MDRAARNALLATSIRIVLVGSASPMAPPALRHWDSAERRSPRQPVHSVGRRRARLIYALGKPKHRVKIDADLRYDATSSSSRANADGTYTYNSLSDVAANAPARFTRSLNSPEQTGAVWNGYVAVGDYYRASPNLQVLYGARLEANVFNERPEYNPAVDAAFGARTDHSPNTMHVSPRIGFTWTYAKKRSGTGTMMNPLGTFIMPQLGVLRGGIGEFRSLMPATLLSNASVNTGLPNAYRQVSCVGNAIPMPDWSSYGSSPGNIPSQCVTGAPMSVLGDTAPGVQLIDRGNNAPRNWRGNLAGRRVTAGLSGR